MGSVSTDHERTEAFVGKVLTDLAGFMATRFATIGDRLGLWKDLAVRGPATPSDLAARTGIAERYAQEWLAGSLAAGYLTHDPGSGTYALPAEHAPVLADEAGPVFFGGVLQLIEGTSGTVEELYDAFRTGGGVPQASFPERLYAGISRFTRGWFENHLLQTWIPAMPDVEAKLRAGCDVADVGAGAGQALIKLATAFPASRFTGYDIFPGQVELARKAVAEAGLADRVSVEVCDVAGGLPDSFDVVTTFDVIHDAIDPAGILQAIRSALRPDGRFVCLDINASDRVEDNVGPLGTLFYGFSVHYCMTTSLAHGGAGLGTCGFNPAVVERMCAEAGFSTVLGPGPRRGRRPPAESAVLHLFAGVSRADVRTRGTPRDVPGPRSGVRECAVLHASGRRVGCSTALSADWGAYGCRGAVRVAAIWRPRSAGVDGPLGRYHL